MFRYVDLWVPNQVGSGTITACLLDIQYISSNIYSVTSPIILLSQSTNLSVIPSEHKIKPKLNLSLITTKVLFTLHLLVTANDGLKFTSALWLSAMFLVYCSRMLSWSPFEAVYMLCPRVDDGALLPCYQSHQRDFILR
jgi:hypothetical protein